jgi:hypothetical protein
MCKIMGITFVMTTLVGQTPLKWLLQTKVLIYLLSFYQTGICELATRATSMLSLADETNPAWADRLCFSWLPPLFMRVLHT